MTVSTPSLPGPPGWPLIGGLGPIARFLIEPLGYLERLFREYGPIVALAQDAPVRLASTARSVPATVFVCGPELNRALLGNHDDFHKSALSGPLWPREPLSDRTRPLTRVLTGLFHVNRDEHRAHRRLIQPAFHRTRVDGYRDDMVAITEAAIAAWTPGHVRDLRPDMNELTLRVASKTLFGAELDDTGVQIGRGLQRWLALMRPAAVVPFDVPGLPYRRWLDTTRAVDTRLRELLAEKRRAAELGSDVLSMLVQATDEAGGKLTEAELIGHASVIFAAGHETSANALCWTLLLLSQHPRVMADLFDELHGTLGGAAPTVDQLARMPLLDRVVKESLRLLPPAPFSHRLAADDRELGGHTVRRGSEILTSVYHTHRDPELYPQPDRFAPERWVNFDPGPYAFIPFGAGARMCIGASFATMELKIVLSILLQRYRFELAPDQRVDHAISITMVPKCGLRMRLHAQDRAFERSRRGLRGTVRQLVAFAPT